MGQEVEMKRFVLGVAVLALLLAAPGRAAAITIYYADFIADGTRTNFNGFESIPHSGDFYTGGTVYDEGGIRVSQINGDPPPDIWVTAFHPEGSFGWYPDGGDPGYTKITKVDGSGFYDVGFLYGTGYLGGATTYYELYSLGVLVLSGSLQTPPFPEPSYLGFGGGGFDEIRMRDDSTLNAFAVDSIELNNGTAPPIPEPGSMLLLGTGLVGLGRAWRKRR
jgi:hypothetical protein